MIPVDNKPRAAIKTVDLSLPVFVSIVLGSVVTAISSDVVGVSMVAVSTTLGSRCCCHSMVCFLFLRHTPSFRMIRCDGGGEEDDENDVVVEVDVDDVVNIARNADT